MTQPWLLPNLAQGHRSRNRLPFFSSQAVSSTSSLAVVSRRRRRRRRRRPSVVDLEIKDLKPVVVVVVVVVRRIFVRIIKGKTSRAS